MKLIVITLVLCIALARQHRPIAGGKHEPDPTDSGVPKAIAFAKSNF
jgi:hypothetical protein